MSPEQLKTFMGPAMAKAAGFGPRLWPAAGVFLRTAQRGLWVQGGGPLAGMEFATLLWLSTIALSTIGSGVWYDKVRPLLKATFWAWLVRMNVAGLIVGLLIK